MPYLSEIRRRHFLARRGNFKRAWYVFGVKVDLAGTPLGGVAVAVLTAAALGCASEAPAAAPATTPAIAAIAPALATATLQRPPDHDEQHRQELPGRRLGRHLEGRCRQSKVNLSRQVG
jgi:hypothetical protein